MAGRREGDLPPCCDDRQNPPTLKYRPTFPARFGSLEDARAFCAAFFTWYNTQHRHAGIGLLTPADVHAGRAAEITASRVVTLDAAYLAHPERFVRRPPTPPEVPPAVWINPPAKEMPPQ
jgi:putative transposase